MVVVFVRRGEFICIGVSDGFYFFGVWFLAYYLGFFYGESFVFGLIFLERGIEGV